MVLVPVIFFVPNIFGKGIIVPALRAVSGGNHQIDQLAPHVSQWHGFNIPLLLTIIIILLGSVLAIKVDWKKCSRVKLDRFQFQKAMRWYIDILKSLLRSDLNVLCKIV